MGKQASVIQAYFINHIILLTILIYVKDTMLIRYHSIRLLHLYAHNNYGITGM